MVETLATHSLHIVKEILSSNNDCHLQKFIIEIYISNDTSDRGFEFETINLQVNVIFGLYLVGNQGKLDTKYKHVGQKFHKHFSS